MGRKDQQVPDRSSAVGRLAQALKDGKRQARRTYADMAKTSSRYCAATYSRAASGTMLPRREVARAYALACGLDVEVIDGLWLAARAASRRVGIERPRHSATRPRLIYDIDDLCVGLGELREREGAPTYAQMRQRAAEAGYEVSTSTLQRIATRNQVPTTEHVLDAYLAACSVSPLRRHEWHTAWARARQRAEDADHARRDVARAEAQVAGGAGVVTAEKAVEILTHARLLPVEGYRGFRAPWSVKCGGCSLVRRVRIADIVLGRLRPCRQCQSKERAVARTWQALVEGIVPLSQQQADVVRRSGYRGLQQVMGIGTLLFEASDPDAQEVLEDPSAEWRIALEKDITRTLGTVPKLDVLVTSDYPLN
ncbi:hypothetical protein ACFT38_42835 [Streptomyces sp. NPDC056975]|uniref:hypothetical protein n=1 Tax=Streptomyces sp. NPDC056975 TaxID=3345985 RepID=UPI003627ADF7